MLNLMIDMTGNIALIGNVFLLLVVICVFKKDRTEDRATKLGFRFLQILMLLNMLAIGGNMAW